MRRRTSSHTSWASSGRLASINTVRQDLVSPRCRGLRFRPTNSNNSSLNQSTPNKRASPTIVCFIVRIRFVISVRCWMSCRRSSSAAFTTSWRCVFLTPTNSSVPAIIAVSPSEVDNDCGTVAVSVCISMLDNCGLRESVRRFPVPKPHAISEPDRGRRVFNRLHQ